MQYNTPSAAASAASPRKNLHARGGRIQEVRRDHDRRSSRRTCASPTWHRACRAGRRALRRTRQQRTRNRAPEIWPRWRMPRPSDLGASRRTVADPFDAAPMSERPTGETKSSPTVRIPTTARGIGNATGASGDTSTDANERRAYATAVIAQPAAIFRVAGGSAPRFACRLGQPRREGRLIRDLKFAEPARPTWR